MGRPESGRGIASPLRENTQPMRHLNNIVVFALVAGLSLLPACGKKEQPPVAATPPPHAVAVKGGQAPDFTLPDLDGKPVSLSSLKGKVVLVNFWATWCPPCKEEIPSMEKLWQRFGKDGLVILAVSVDKISDEELKKFVQERKMTFTVLRDNSGGKLGQVAEGLYGTTGVPETFIVDRNGIIQEKVIGAAPWDAPEVIDFFTNLLKS